VWRIGLRAVRNLTLTRSRVPDMNGAGIRLVKGSLTVDTVKFIDNQTGLLSGAPGTMVTIRNSDFVIDLCALLLLETQAIAL
jgi:hypothetical protein